MNKNNKTNASYKTNKTYRTYRTYLVLFVLLFSFFIAPAKPARAAALSRPPTNLGLVGYWPMNEGVGAKAGDFSGNGNTGTITGASWVDGKKGKALSFDGVSGYISLPQSSTISPSSQVTVALWMNLQKVPVEAYELLSKSSGYVGYAYVTGATNATLNFGKYTGGVFHHLCEYTSCPALSYNSWHHVVYVYQSGFTGIYIDGILSASTTSMTGSIDVNSNPIMFNSRQLHKGSFDDVRIYNRALSATEVSKLYQSGAVKQKTVSNLGLVGYWPMNEGRGTKAGDSSGQGNTGTITGATWINGKRGGALSFNGSSNWVNISNSTTLNQANFTAFAWFKTTSSSDQKIISNNISYHQLQTLNGHLRICVNGCTEGSTIVNDNKWHLAVVVGDATSIRAYLDGNSTAEITQSVSSNDMTGTFSIGKVGNGDSSYPFNGLIDDVRIYNRALTAAEIQNLYKQGSATIGTSYENRLTNGLVGFWTMNGKDYNSASTTAEVLDKSGNNNNGDNSGATPAIGKLGQALSFNGLNSYVYMPNNTANNNMTFSGWIKPSVANGYIATEGIPNSGIRYQLYFSSQKLAWGCYQGPWVTVMSDNAISTGVWTHFVAVIDSTISNGMALYINGIKQANTDTITACSPYGGLYLGAYIWPISDYYKGLLDEVRIYNRALSADEIKQLYLMGK